MGDILIKFKSLPISGLNYTVLSAVLSHVQIYAYLKVHFSFIAKSSHRNNGKNKLYGRESGTSGRFGKRTAEERTTRPLNNPDLKFNRDQPLFIYLLCLLQSLTGASI